MGQYLEKITWERNKYKTESHLVLKNQLRQKERFELSETGTEHRHVLLNNSYKSHQTQEGSIIRHI